MKKIVNPVLALILAVLMVLIGFVYYAWEMQRRCKSTAQWMVQTNRQIDMVRNIINLESSYTNSIRDMLLTDKVSLPPTAYTLPDSIRHILSGLRAITQNDTPSSRILTDLHALLEEKFNYNQQILHTAAQQPTLAKQLITAPKSTDFKKSILEHLNTYIHINRDKLVTQVENNNEYTRLLFRNTIFISLFMLILLLGESRYIYRLFLQLKIHTNRLLKREQSFMRLAEETELIVFRATIDGHFTSVSKRAAQITGYTNTELIGKHYALFLDDETHQQLETLYVNQMQTGDDYTFQEFEIITKSGNRKWVEQLAALIYGPDGRIQEFQCIVRDIDKRKRDAGQTEYLQKRLDAIIDYMPSMMFIKDAPGKYLLVNNRFTDIMGINKKDIIGKTDEELPYDWVSRYAKLDEQVMATGNRVKLEDEIRVGGKDYHFLITKFPLRNTDEEIIGICGIGQDFTEKANYIKAMEEASKAAQEAINAQEMFLANMSHEIRTPMNGILGMTNLLIQQNQLSPAQLEYTNAIKASANHLLVIINEILDFSKIKAGKLHLQHEPFDVYEVIDKALFPLRLQAQQKGLSFFDEIDNTIPTTLLGDGIRLNQILTNLVENAIKFTPEGKITVKASQVKENNDPDVARLGFQITDTGIGIAPGQHDLIFKSFSQTHTDNTRKYGGTGLGLAISKELIELQNGFIQVTSNLNEGATFYFELPFTRYNGDLIEKVEKNQLAHVSKPLQGKNILVVEDNEINQQVVFYTLHDAGARTDVVNNGQSALEMLQHKAYDCIIMDIQMPGIDGYQTTRAIREKGIHTCIIAMTASALKRERERCLNAGMNDYISKPFERTDLFLKILKGLEEQLPESPSLIQTMHHMPDNDTSLNFTAVYNMMSGEPEHIKILLEELLSSIPKKFSEMNQLATERNWQPLYMLAHQMKFNLNLAGLSHASDIAWGIERDARLEENVDTIASRLDELMKIYYSKVHLIREHINQC